MPPNAYPLLKLALIVLIVASRPGISKPSVDPQLAFVCTPGDVKVKVSSKSANGYSYCLNSNDRVLVSSAITPKKNKQVQFHQKWRLLADRASTQIKKQFDATTPGVNESYQVVFRAREIKMPQLVTGTWQQHYWQFDGMFFYPTTKRWHNVSFQGTVVRSPITDQSLG